MKDYKIWAIICDVLMGKTSWGDVRRAAEVAQIILRVQEGKFRFSDLKDISYKDLRSALHIHNTYVKDDRKRISISNMVELYEQFRVIPNSLAVQEFEKGQKLV